MQPTATAFDEPLRRGHGHGNRNGRRWVLAAEMMAFYFQLFWLPAGVSAVLLLLLWVYEGLPRPAPAFIGWFVVAVSLQFFAPIPLAWVCGLLLQTALAVVLLIAYQLERI